jgi:DNA polymerase III subunit gamma/tau
LSYQVLARKWRPQSFEEVTGQEHVTTALRNAIATGRVPHAVLLCGPRGVGKTTIARILSRCLNCVKGPTDTPCGVCPSCTEIAAGTSTDVQEIDAASRTSVDDVRELIEAVRYAPSPGKYRIFVVDEVHMLSTPAFNALLKTLEEPPPRSLFVFATTNPEKIPFTVVSRCQRYDLRRLPTLEVAARLAEVAKAEGIGVSQRSVLAIAREGDGSLRDSLTLLDQVIAMGGTEVDDDRVAEVLDLIDRRVLLAILAACVDADPAAALAACGRAAEAGIDQAPAGSLVKLLRDLVVLRIAPIAEPGGVGGGARRAALAGSPRRARAPAPHVPRAGSRAGGPRLGARALRRARDGGGAPRDPRGRRRRGGAAGAPRRTRAAPGGSPRPRRRGPDRRRAARGPQRPGPSPAQPSPPKPADPSPARVRGRGLGAGIPCGRELHAPSRWPYDRLAASRSRRTGDSSRGSAGPARRARRADCAPPRLRSPRALPRGRDLEAGVRALLRGARARAGGLRRAAPGARARGGADADDAAARGASRALDHPG